MFLVQSGFGPGIKEGHIFGERESQRRMVSIQLPFTSIYRLNREVTNYWYTCVRAAFNDPDWFVKDRHAIYRAKRKVNTTCTRVYRRAWREHRDRYQQNMEKLESENMELKRRLGEAKRDIDAYK